MKCNPVYRLILALLILPLTGCASLQYSAAPIEAWVVDAETKQPLEGVIITANWPYADSTFAGRGSDLGQLMVMETVTDKEGRFHFPGWGPRKPERGYMRDNDPQLLLFKSGYEYLRLTNDYSSGKSLEGLHPVWRSEWNGRTVELRPFEIALEKRRKGELEGRRLWARDQCQGKVSLRLIAPEAMEECQAIEEHREALKPAPFPGTVEEEYARDLEDLNNALDHIISAGPEKCNWKKFPNTIRAMHEERKRLIQLGVSKHLSTIDHRILSNDDYYTKKGCGSPKEFFQDLIP